ncbi:hypothetical protein K440DRAFT_660272 [Wilcoxina mikolae CBS 423.85]|nr:hypothetical protein K440DRAFT_660272 [Wilcoxina mikolae CBS 423.85]
MTTSTLSAASAALDSLLSGSSAHPPISSKPRRKKSTKRTTATTTVSLDVSDLDPAAQAQREAEEKRRIEASVKALNRAKVRKEELEVRERILEMRDSKSGKKGKKRKAVVEDDSD